MPNIPPISRPYGRLRDQSHLLDRAISRVRRTFDRHALDRSLEGGDLPDGDALAELVEGCLSPRGGEVAARERAAALGRRYAGASDAERVAFLLVLRERFGCDVAGMEELLRAPLAASDEAGRARALLELRRALDPPRLALFRRFSTMPQGIRFLVDLRADLLRFRAEHPSLAVLESELKELLSTWFDVGLLELRRIDWSAPAALLEQLIAHEAVHAIQSWTDLKNRLDRDRRVYAFFHPSMPESPLIFVEVALTRGLAQNVQELLDEGAPLLDPRQADTAIFYSISNAQRGLDGISFGNFLIKRVVEQLSGEMPNLRTFATLSPLPGFRRWLESVAADEEERARLASVLGARTDLVALASALRNDEPADEAALERLAAYYLAHARHRGGRALDPVAHFHLANGARLERISPRADRSAKGWAQSAGLMVSYRYLPEEIEANVDAYTGGGTVRMDAAVRRLLPKAG